VPLLEPHRLLAEQLAAEPPLMPEQVHDHGPEPETEEAMPAPQRLAEGVEGKYEPPDEPHVPLTTKFAEQLALVPPYRPEQVHDHGPAPDNAEALPAVQRPEDGAE